MDKQKFDEVNDRDLKLRNKLKILIAEWFKSSTSHGLPNIFRTDKAYLKIFWIICFLSSTAFCSYIILRSIYLFFEWNVTVSTSIEIDMPILFPSVTICNINPFYRPRAMNFISATLESYNLTDSVALNQLKNGQTALSITKTALNILKAEAVTNPNYNSTYRQQLGFYLDDMLLSCTFGVFNCTSNDFTLLKSYEYGNCYTFNGDRNSRFKTISAAGSDYGLQIELFSGDPNNELIVYKRGFYIAVHNQSTTPILDSEGVFAGVGVETNIGISRRYNFKQSAPYSNCIVDPSSNSSSSSILYQATLNILGEKSYRQKYCLRLCYQLAVIMNCSCFDPR